MAPGPPNLETNRWAPLMEVEPRIKRKTGKNINNEIFPSLPTTFNSKEDPKYIVISSKNSNKSLAEYSCFAVHRSLKIISNDILSISELRDGSLLLLLKNSASANKFISCKSLPGICEITSKFHDNLNHTKGTIYAPFLKNLPDSEIISELKSNGVVDVYKFQKSVDGSKQPSGVILLTFDRYNLPSNIDIAWRKLDVKQFFPNPMRCKNCQLLGHTIKYCKRAPACVTCNLPPHTPIDCKRIFCANCYGEHQASSPDCPKFQQSKEILKIKISKKCTMREAITQYRQLNPIATPSNILYSSVIKFDTSSHIKNINNSSNINKHTSNTSDQNSINTKTNSKNITYNTATKLSSTTLNPTTKNTTQQNIR